MDFGIFTEQIRRGSSQGEWFGELLELRDGSTFTYLDTLTGGLYREDESELEHYRDTWDRLTASALDFHKSVEVIRRAADEHRSGRGDKRRGREMVQE